MKCQRCPKPATLHITEVLSDDRYEEFHFCEDCAKKYLYPNSNGKKPSTSNAMAEMNDDPSAKQCRECGIKFVEFRNSGRLGCPHDYRAFQAELIPLLESIHGQTRHSGKTPRRLPRKKATQQEISRLRKDLLQAVNKEDYEVAARIRDQIRRLEELATS